MSTPDFLPQNDTNYSQVRFYTALDPYFYTVDNRPLQDLEANIKASRTGGGDSARRAAAILGLNLASVMTDLYSAPDRTTVMTGLDVFKPSSNVVRIGPGAVYESRTITSTNTDKTFKQALVTETTNFNVPAPVTGGTSIVYTVVGDFVELVDANLSTSHLPYVDSTNVYLASTLVHAELRLRLVSGVATATGSEVPAVISTGIPLYNLTVANGSTDFKVALHAAAPYCKSMNMFIQSPKGVTGGAVVEYLTDTHTYKMPPGVISTLFLPATLKSASLSPYKPIKLKIEFSATVAGGTFPLVLRYKAFGVNELIATATTTSVEAVPVTSSVGSVSTYTTTFGVPVTEFAGFVNGQWVVNKEFLNLVLDRTAAAGNAGNMNILSITLVQ